MRYRNVEFIGFNHYNFIDIMYIYSMDEKKRLENKIKISKMIIALFSLFSHVNGNFLPVLK